MAGTIARFRVLFMALCGLIGCAYMLDFRLISLISRTYMLNFHIGAMTHVCGVHFFQSF
jgi:hypothetical protein